MGSIYVNYFGRCSDHGVQRELVGHVQRIAQRSEARIGMPLERGVMLENMTAQREQIAAKEVASIRLFDERLTGTIILDPLVAGQPREMMEEAEQRGVPKGAIEAGGKDKNEPSCISVEESSGQWVLQPESLHVFGIDFELYDPRKLYPSANRLSFVFIHSPELPLLDGSLCQVENHDQCRAYYSDLIQAADWFLTTPNIHLRYLLEEWTDSLLSWVKYFFLRELYFSRYDELPGYESFQQRMQGRSADQAKVECVQQLMDAFEEQADEWDRRVGLLQ